MTDLTECNPSTFQVYTFQDSYSSNYILSVSQEIDYEILLKIMLKEGSQ